MAGRKMTLDEIALMREVFRWARNNSVGATAWHHSWRQGMTGKMVAEGGGTIGWAPDRWTDYHWLAVDSVTQAIDVLVAVGYLPRRFSSAYLKGWEAAMVWEKCDEHDAIFRNMFQQVENISFPAGEPAW